MNEQSTSQRGTRFLIIAAAPLIFGTTAVEAQLKKWRAKTAETGDGPGRTTAMAGPRHGAQRWWRLIAGVLALALVAPGAGLAAEQVSNELILPSLKTDWAADYAMEPVSAAPASPSLGAEWGTGSGKSYLIPALEIPAFLWLLNRFDRTVFGSEVYGTNWNTGWHHVIHGGWTLDTDPFGMNMIGHPYQGSLFFGFARSSGLGFWESVPYNFGGSYLWKMWGETGRPSVNDMIMTPIGGSFLGEALFRMASYVLEGSNGKPGYWRELGAAGLSPPTGLNRLAFGNRFKAVWVSNDPATFTRLRLGASLSSHLTDQGVGSTVKGAQATGDFSMAYGLPGKPGYSYERPFDYFHFEFTAVGSSGNSFENIMTRGLLYGKKYSAGDDYRGVWGLYGSYDYISPETFRVASSALSIGTTAQWWIARAVALQGSALGGIGYGAAGTIAPVGNPTVGERDYHYGVVPQGLLALRLIFGEAAMLDLTGRDYYVSGVGSDDSHGSERIFRGNASFTVRVYGRHGISFEYVQSRRNAYYANLPNRHQEVETYSVVYNFLGDTKFGAVEWRDFSADRR